MRLTVIGASGSFPGPGSPASCYLVRARHEGRDWSILLDLGPGALGALQRHTDPLALDAVFLSHLHPDHCVDLTGLYVMRRYHPARSPERFPLPVWGPADTARRIAAAYGTADGPLDAEFDFRAYRAGEPVELGPFTVTPYPVEHPVEAFGLRVEADGAVLAFTGDTDACAGLTPLLTGADLALCDCAFVDGRDEARGIHLSGSRAAAAAVAAGGVRRLMLTHLPVWNDPDVCRRQAGTVWPGGAAGVEVAEPGATYEL